MQTLRFRALTPDDAASVIGWRYPPPYDVYNIDTDNVAAEVAHLIDPKNHYYALLESGVLIGHAAFHQEARVPGGDYPEKALDVGWGMHPNITGRGAGTATVAQILQFGLATYGEQPLRATVAAWNLRGQKVCTNNGFVAQRVFKHAQTNVDFVIMLKSQAKCRKAPTTTEGDF